jgi:hypothetical protein
MLEKAVGIAPCFKQNGKDQMINFLAQQLSTA